MFIIAVDPGETSGIVVAERLTARVHLVDRMTRRGKNRGALPPSMAVEMLSARYAIEHAVIEGQYVGINPHSAIVLAANRGRWDEGFAREAIPWTVVKPSVWQTAIIKRKGRSEQLEKLSIMIAFQDTGQNLNEHESDAWCMARWWLERRNLRCRNNLK